MSNQGVTEIVIAANYNKYKQYINAHKLNPRQSIYIDRPDLLDGLHNVTVTIIDEPWGNPAFRDPRIVKNQQGYYVLTTN